MHKLLALLLSLATSPIPVDEKQEEADIVAMASRDAPSSSIAVNPKRITFADGGWVEFEVRSFRGFRVFPVSRLSRLNENKKFDLVLMSQAGYELPPGYAMVRKWYYFVEYLAWPPSSFLKISRRSQIPI